MAKWEYKVIDQTREVTGNSLVGYKIGPIPTAPETEELLSAHGEKGWELVNTYIINPTERFTQVVTPTVVIRFVFKRETY